MKSHERPRLRSTSQVHAIREPKRPIPLDWFGRRLKRASLWASRLSAEAEAGHQQKLMADWDKALAESRLAVTSVLPLFKCMFTDLGVDRRDYAYLERRSQEEGWHFLANRLPALDKALLQGLSSGVFIPPDDFRCLNGERVPRFLRELWIQIFTPTGELLEIGIASPIAVQMLRQVFGFVYKADVPCDPDKNAFAVQQFVATENELVRSLSELKDPIDGTHVWDHDRTLQLASLLIGRLFCDYSRDKLVFRHGPGVTSNCPIEDKFETRLSQFPSVWEFGNSFFFNERDINERSSRFEIMTHKNLFEVPTASLKLVPKDARGPRIISAEPVENQWAQQGIRGYMYERVHANPLTSGHVNFTDQSVNRTMAYAASVTRNWATLDLKEASDRVTCDLVERVFSKVPTLLRDFVATRSEVTQLPSGRVLRLAKFAPMGSALCFPVLATVIWSIIVASFVELGWTLDQAIQLVYIYGDDVIVPSSVAEYATAALERYLLLVNRDKSFVFSRFAESCGGDYFDGNDVTPLRLRRCPTNPSDPEVAASLVPLANELTSLGYVELAERLYEIVEGEYGKLPYGYSCSPFLNRTLLSFMGECAFARTQERIKVRVGFVPLVQRSARWFNAPVVVSREKVKSESVSFGGHALRIWPSLGGTSLPLPGEFDKRSSIVVETMRIPEDWFSKYPINRWVPSDFSNTHIVESYDSRGNLKA